VTQKKVTVQYLPDYTYSQLLTAGHHSYVSDEPEVANGNDLGPGPYELLLWALGSCTAMTLLMYARTKGWDLADVSVHLTHDRVYADDRSNAEHGTGKVEVIERQISIRGDLSEEQRQRLLEIAGRCPVHKTIMGSVKVVDSIIAGA
jgi:putative redox protein